MQVEKLVSIKKKLLSSPFRFYTVIAGIYLLSIPVFILLSQNKAENYLDKQEVWEFIKEEAERRSLNPEFVYSIAMAESSLNGYANSGYARGIMQVTRPAWKTVTDESYGKAYNWKLNVVVALDYLVYLRSFLKKHDAFEYNRLAVAYRFGPNYLKRRKFRMDKVKNPKNEIYQKLFRNEVIAIPSLAK